MTESRAWKLWQTRKYITARDFLLQLHSGLVYKHISLAKRSNLATFLSDDDIIVAGMLGLLKAIETFDPLRGTVFSTHAMWQIRRAVQNQYRDAYIQPAYRVEDRNREDKPLTMKFEVQMSQLNRPEHLNEEQLLDQIIFQKDGNAYWDSYNFDSEITADILSSMPEKHRKYVKEIYINGKTLRAVGLENGISREMVRIHCEKGLNSARKTFRPELVD